MGAVAWCIELAFIASLMLVYNIQWNRALSARSASGTGKSVWATRRAIRGMDFACAEDADGSTPDACQIRRAAPRAARVRIGCGCGSGLKDAVAATVTGWGQGRRWRLASRLRWQPTLAAPSLHPALTFAPPSVRFCAGAARRASSPSCSASCSRSAARWRSTPRAASVRASASPNLKLRLRTCP